VTSLVEHPAGPELLIQIGDMTVSFTLLELRIQMLLSALIGQQHGVGQVIATQLPFARLRATVAGVYRERHGEDDDFQTLKQLLDEAAEIEQERNRITHSIWGMRNSSHKITRMKPTCRQKRGLQFQFEQYDEARFVHFNNRIKRLIGGFIGFHDALLEKGKAIDNAAGNIP
jgi:hypothetical protein